MLSYDAGLVTTTPPIGPAIRDARERKQWTQEQLAKAVGTTRRTVDNWENGRTSPKNRIGALERELGVDLRGDVGRDTYVGEPGPQEGFSVVERLLLEKMDQMQRDIADLKRQQRDEDP